MYGGEDDSRPLQDGAGNFAFSEKSIRLGKTPLLRVWCITPSRDLYLFVCLFTRDLHISFSNEYEFDAVLLMQPLTFLSMWKDTCIYYHIMMK